jgi:hypothetical protein
MIRLLGSQTLKMNGFNGELARFRVHHGNGLLLGVQIAS